MKNHQTSEGVSYQENFTPIILKFFSSLWVCVCATTAATSSNNRRYLRFSFSFHKRYIIESEMWENFLCMCIVHVHMSALHRIVSIHNEQKRGWICSILFPIVKFSNLIQYILINDMIVICKKIQQKDCIYRVWSINNFNRSQNSAQFKMLGTTWICVKKIVINFTNRCVCKHLLFFKRIIFIFVKCI